MVFYLETSAYQSDAFYSVVTTSPEQAEKNLRERAITYVQVNICCTEEERYMLQQNTKDQGQSDSHQAVSLWESARRITITSTYVSTILSHRGGPTAVAATWNKAIRAKCRITKQKPTRLKSHCMWIFFFLLYPIHSFYYYYY